LKEETMANGTRPLVLVLTLIVGLAVGWLIHSPAPTPPPPPPPPPPPTCPTPGNHLIEVGPTAKEVSERNAAISAEKGHKIFWIAKGEEKPLSIEFRVADFPPEAKGEPPFEKGTNGQPQVISCNAGGICKAGRVNPNLKLLACPASLYYKYYQTLGGVTEDAGIIIEK
jgi:hypothetical protein